MNAIKTKNQKRTQTVKPTENAFAGAADVLGAGIDALFAQSDDPEFLVDLDDIEIAGQVREQMEDDEQDLISLGESLAKYQIQAILLRIMPPGHPKPYRLVAGERRCHAARLKGLTQLRAKARELSDDEAEDLQFAENIHRKNLTQIEEARKIQRDLDRLGSVDAVLLKYQKNRPWLSKVLSLLNLPEQAKRLVAENVSADLEVINMLKTIEKADKNAARELVEDLKATRGKSNAREKALAVKEKVKPGRKAPGGPAAAAKDRSQEEPGPVTVFAPAKNDSAAEILNKAYTRICGFGSNPKTILDGMSAGERITVDAWLRSYYDAGAIAKNVARAVIQGFRDGWFSSSSGEGAFSLVAFLQGNSKAEYNLLNVFGSLKE